MIKPIAQILTSLPVFNFSPQNKNPQCRVYQNKSAQKNMDASSFSNWFLRAERAFHKVRNESLKVGALTTASLLLGSTAYAQDVVADHHGFFVTGAVISIISTEIGLVKWAMMRSQQLDQIERNKVLKLQTSSQLLDDDQNGMDPIQYQARCLKMLCQKDGIRVLYEYLVKKEPSQESVLREFLKLTTSRDEIHVALNALDPKNQKGLVSAIALVESRQLSREITADLIDHLVSLNSNDARMILADIALKSKFEFSREIALYYVSKTFQIEEAIPVYKAILDTEWNQKILRDTCYYLSLSQSADAPKILTEILMNNKHYMIHHVAIMQLIEFYPEIAVGVLSYMGMCAETERERIQVLLYLSQIKLDSAREAYVKLHPFFQSRRERLYYATISLISRASRSDRESN